MGGRGERRIGLAQGGPVLWATELASQWGGWKPMILTGGTTIYKTHIMLAKFTVRRMWHKTQPIFLQKLKVLGSCTTQVK